MLYKRNSSWDKFSQMLDAWLAHTHVRSVTMIISQIIRAFVRYESNQYSENLKKFSFLWYSVSAVRFLGKKIFIGTQVSVCFVLCMLLSKVSLFIMKLKVQRTSSTLCTNSQTFLDAGRQLMVDTSCAPHHNAVQTQPTANHRTLNPAGRLWIQASLVMANQRAETKCTHCYRLCESFVYKENSFLGGCTLVKIEGYKNV